MVADSERLYDEFLQNYGLEKGLYYHSIELLDHPFEQIEKVQAVRIGDQIVPVSPAVANSVKFNIQLHYAQIQAEKEIKKYIGSYKGLILDEDDVNLFCFTAEQAVLTHLLWPFHLLTFQAQLEEKDFFPLADMMEGVVLDTQEALFAFLQAVLGSTDRIDAARDRDIDRMNRQTDAWAANAPVEVRGSIRRYGNHIEVAATARSTVTSGMVNADYQAHNLLANQQANREKATAQRSYMQTLENRLLEIISSYRTLWYDRLKQLGKIIGKNVLRDSIIPGDILHRPDQKDNLIAIIKQANGGISFANLKRLMTFYGHDCDELFGERVAIRINNSFIKDHEIDVNSFFYKFYAYFYDVEHPLEHEAFYNRFRQATMETTRAFCQKCKEQHPDVYTAENDSRLLTQVKGMIDALLGITDRQRNRMKDDAYAVFYEVLGDAAQSEYYKNGIPRFEF